MRMLIKVFTFHRHMPLIILKIVSKYDQEIPQSQTADKPMAPPRRAAQQS